MPRVDNVSFARRAAAWLLPFTGIAAMLLCGPMLSPWQRLAAATLGMLFLMKGVVLLKDPRKLPIPGLLLFLFAWPGMDPEPLRAPAAHPGSVGEAMVQGFPRLWLGLAILLATVLLQPQLGARATGWLGILGLLTFIHFGFSEILCGALRSLGWAVPRLFDDPFRSASLREFWGRRWNRAFVEMDRRLFLRPLRARLGKAGGLLTVFAVSGLLHELAISYPVASGWGKPLGYFLLQGALVLGEGRLRVDRWPRWTAALWTWTCLLLPLPWLFHSAFREGLIVPLFAWAHELLPKTPEQLLGYGLWFVATGHFLVLSASFQVPARLKWKVELARLTPLNRKIVWTYGGFILLCIIAFGILLFALHDELLAGGPAALGLLAFNGAFWGLRVIVDLWVYRHDEWPPGSFFQTGHVMISAMFTCLAALPLALLAWRLLA